MDKNEVIIQGNIATWDIRKEGSINGTYTGTFTFRCYLTPSQKIAANREYRELLGPQMTMTPEHESFLAYALTQLKYRVITAPPFWNTESKLGVSQGDLPDEEVIAEILEAAFAAELKYKEQIKQRKEEALQKAKEAAEKHLKSREVLDEGPSEETSDKS